MSQTDMPAQSLRIVVTGGGSGGHITPVLAVAHELRTLRPDCEVLYIGQKGDSLSDIPERDPSITQAYGVRAGKFRRYHGAGWRQLLDIPTIAKNIRDGFYVLAGVIQSHRLLRRLKPQVVFVKGGFVGVPVGLAAAWLKIPIVTHDSDAIPGLANRIISRWATIHAVALPKEVYAYPADKTVTVGVPISHRYHPYSAAEQQAVRQTLGFAADQRILLVTGGGNGAARLNNNVADCVPALFKQYPELVVVQLAGRSLEAALKQRYKNSLSAEDLARVRVEGFISNLYDFSAIAEIVVTRAGGTSMAEFAAQAKACIVIPNPELTGGHQTKNAQVLVDKHAIILIDEPTLAAKPTALQTAIGELLDNPKQAQKLGQNLHTIAHPDAARQLAMVLLEQAPQTKVASDNHA